MRKVNLFTTLAIVATLSLGLVACGGNKESDAASDISSVSISSQSQSEEDSSSESVEGSSVDVSSESSEEATDDTSNVSNVSESSEMSATESTLEGSNETVVPDEPVEEALQSSTESIAE